MIGKIWARNIRIKNHKVSLAYIGSFVYCPVSVDIESAAEDVIYDLVSGAVAAVPFVQNPTLEEILESDRLAREYVRRNAKS